MSDAISAADACVAILKPIELYKTVYPNKVFDYMAAGRPVILAIDGVIREVVENACAGVPVQPGNPEALAEAIRGLFDDPKTGREMGRNGRKYVKEHFERSQLAKHLLEIMEGMIEPS
jgi:glycosyltransferase involved in cell wall biosynthesis